MVDETSLFMRMVVMMMLMIVMMKTMGTLDWDFSILLYLAEIFMPFITFLVVFLGFSIINRML